MQTEDVAIPARPERKFLPDELRIEDWNSLKPYFDDLLARSIDDREELEDWIKDLSELEAVLSEETAWRYIRMNIDTKNEAYADAFEFMITEIEPKTAPYSDRFNRKLTSSPYLNELDRDTYGIFLRGVEMQMKIYREENIPLLTRLQQKQQVYGTITGDMSVEHEGKTLTLQMAASLLKDTDRELRKNIFEKVNQVRLAKAEELDTLFSELVQLRHQVAQQADHANYRDYKFDALGRFDYTPEDCAAFHEAIRKECVPLLDHLHRERKQNMGVESLKPYDLDVDPLGRDGLKPFEGEKELIHRTVECFGRVRPFYAECLRTMNAMGHLDLESRLGKAPGGFNYPLHEIGVPFIFMNAVGSVRDLVTMVHEGGHAVHSFFIKDLEITAFKNVPSEVAELASMSMELLTIDHWDVFFDNEEDLKRAKKEHLTKVISVLPWVATIDRFQHWIYENPGHSADERAENWLRISGELSSDVVDFSGYEKAQRYQWQKQLHLYEVPFYYIEYGMAQLGAIAVWRNFRQNPDKALDQYDEALKLGYTRSIGDIYRTAGIEFDFSQEYVKELMDFVWNEYTQL